MIAYEGWMLQQLVQVFDSWAGELTPRDFRLFALPYLQQIASSVRKSLDEQQIPQVPMTVFAKSANHAIDLLADSGYDVVGLDWTISGAEARKTLAGKKVALQGNLDPSLLYADDETIKREVAIMFSDKEGFGRTGSHIANLGHGALEIS